MIFLKKTNIPLHNQDFKMIVKEDSIYVNHFKKIVHLEENNISFITKHKRIQLYGKNLKMKKLVDQEVLFQGSIEKIEVQDA